MSLPANAHASPYARVALAAYWILILYASWFPFTGWTTNNLAALPVQLREMPRYWGQFDASINVLGYIPFGALLVLALYPRWRGFSAWLLASLLGTLTSLLAESVQIMLPSRVTSLLDFLTNSAGATVGALLGLLLTRWLLVPDRLHAWRSAWLQREASRDLLIIGLWPLAQIYPQAYLYGLGLVLPHLSQLLSDALEMDIDIASWLLRAWEFSPDEYLMAEAVITACGIAGACLILLSLLSRQAPHGRLSLLLILASLAIKALASALFFKPDYAFIWLTPGARGGLLLGLLLLYGCSYAPAQVQRRLALLFLGIALLVLNLVSDNPYFQATLQGWTQGKFLNFNGAALFLSALWPFLAIWVLLRKPGQPGN